MKKSLLGAAALAALITSPALGAGDVRSERGVLAIAEHAEIRGFNSFELVYQDDGLFTNQSGSVTDRDGAAGSSYIGTEVFTVAFNNDVSVQISADQDYYYLSSLLNPAVAGEKDRIDSVVDRLKFEDEAGVVETTSLGYRSLLDTLVDSAGEKSLELSSTVQLGDVDDQKAGVYQRVYTVTVASDSI